MGEFRPLYNARGTTANRRSFDCLSSASNSGTPEPLSDPIDQTTAGFQRRGKRLSHHDSDNNITSIANSGQIVERYDYDLYGTPTVLDPCHASGADTDYPTCVNVAINRNLPA